MKQVIVYVEGESDRLAMERLLKSLIEQKASEAIRIVFEEPPSGNKKKLLIEQVPQCAANIISNNPHTLVVIMPDLYPKNIGFPHETYDELRDGVMKHYRDALKRKGLLDDARYLERFKAFCFKHELEALILAAEDELKLHLETDTFKITWTIPVEDQNHNHPPKQIVQELFQAHGKKYRETQAVDILKGADYRAIAEACPQCFKPFVEFLQDLSTTDDN